MKIGRWIGLGIFLSIVGVGITAVRNKKSIYRSDNGRKNYAI